LATALVALVAAVALFGLAFPQLLAPAVAIAVLAAIVALDWLLPSGELRQVSARFGSADGGSPGSSCSFRTLFAVEFGAGTGRSDSRPAPRIGRGSSAGRRCARN
jgi:hypothetical protein